MDDLTFHYPRAVTDHSEEAQRLGFVWCLRHRKPGEHLTVWSYLKSNIRGSALADLVTSTPSVNHITKRGGGIVNLRGPVLMLAPEAGDIDDLTSRDRSNNITAPCITAWNVPNQRPWVVARDPEFIGVSWLWEEQLSHEDIRKRYREEQRA